MQTGEQDMQMYSWRPILASELFTEMLSARHSTAEFFPIRDMAGTYPYLKKKLRIVTKPFTQVAVDLKGGEKQICLIKMIM